MGFHDDLTIIYTGLNHQYKSTLREHPPETIVDAGNERDLHMFGMNMNGGCDDQHYGIDSLRTTKQKKRGCTNKV